VDAIKIIIILVLLSSCNNDKKTKVATGEVSSLGNKKEVSPLMALVYPPVGASMSTQESLLPLVFN